MSTSDQVGVTPETVATEDVANDNSSDYKANEAPTFDIPRPMLTIQQAASFLGKSVRALETSLLGRWGNKLPDGWSSRKIKTDRGDEWRIIPPPGFRVRSHSAKTEAVTGTDISVTMQNDWITDLTVPAKRPLYRSEHSL